MREEKKEVKVKGEGEQRRSVFVDAASTVARHKTLPPSYTYTYTFILHLLTLPILSLALSSHAATLHWVGTTSASASAAANWTDENGAAATAAPQTGDAVVLDEAGRDHAMTWDLDGVTLASWTQTSDYTNTVTFKTGLTGRGSTVCGVLTSDESNRVLKVSGNVTVSSGIWTGTLNPSFSSTSVGWQDGRGVYQLMIDVGGDMTVGAGVRIHANDLGYYRKHGPGAHNNGASHGGTGASNGIAYNTHCYGDIRNPVTIGSGAGNDYSRGGGAVILTVGGTLRNDGTISADTAAWPKGYYYNAAGGSVNIRAGSLAGSGLVSAYGSNGSADTSGGGGRVSVRLTGADADFSAYTGIFSAISKGGNGFPGTVYLETKADSGKGKLVVGGRGQGRTNQYETNLAARDFRSMGTEISGVLGSSTYEFDTILLTNGAYLVINSNCTVKAKNVIGDDIDKSQILLFGGTLELLSGAFLTNATIYVCADGSQILADGTNTLDLVGAGLGVDLDWTCTVTNVHVGRGGKITHTYHPNCDGRYYHLGLTVNGDVTVDEGGAVNVCGLGYRTRCGPGQSGGNSGGHGGQPSKNTLLGYCYGSVRKPATYGSGGGCSAGGGRCLLNVGGTLTVNGTIDATGASANEHPGAGGSICIRTRSLAGAGTVNADGGQGWGSQWTDSGGGGRIAVYVSGARGFADFTGTIHAYGGKNGASKPVIVSAAGSVFLHEATDGGEDEGGTLRFDNGGSSSEFLTEFTPSVTDALTGNVIITNGARVKIYQNSALQFSGAWRNYVGANGFSAENADSENTAGEVEVVDATRTASVEGANAFSSFTCTAAGKRIEFGTAASDLLTIQAGGTLTLTGGKSADTKIVMRPLVADAAWKIALTESAMAKVRGVDVAWSDASAGNVIQAMNSTNAGDNVNWTFLADIEPGEVITWTGKESAQWTSAGNWSPERKPIETDCVVIAPSVRDPLLVEATVFNSLTVQSGATLRLNTYDVEVTNVLTVAGTLKADGVETLTLCGDVNFTGGTFVPAESTIRFVSNDVQNVKLGGTDFNRLVVAKGGGSMAFSGGMKANWFTCELDHAMTLSFDTDGLFEARNWKLDGRVGGAATLTLNRSAAWGRWRIKASEFAFAEGVIVSDSDASEGKAFVTAAPSVGQDANNVNWVFDVETATWQGADYADFGVAGNWSGGKVPDADTRLVFDGTARMTLNEAVTVRDLRGADGAAVQVFGTGSLTANETLDVQTNALLEFNVPLRVKGNVLVRNGGTLTHSTNDNWNAVDSPLDTTKFRRLFLNVEGDLVVEAGGKVCADCRGYPAARSKAAGPGHSESYGSAAHGCEKGNEKLCYGSIKCPVSLGSGGWSTDGAGAGGGAVRLVVAGTTRIDGEVSANVTKVSEYNNGSGGSVWLTTGRLEGKGTIQAYGGAATHGENASGGRIAVYLTAQETTNTYSGTIQSYGYTNVRGPLQGTVYIEGRNGWGTLSCIGANATTTGVYPLRIPAGQYAPKENFRKVNLLIGGGAHVKLNADRVVFDDFDFASDTGLRFSQLQLEDNLLQLYSWKHRNEQTKAGTYSPTWKGTVGKGSNGQGRIFWSIGEMIIIR